MKTYAVSIDITVSRTLYVDAENEEQAKQIATEKVDKEPYYYAQFCDAFVKQETIDIHEDNN